MGTRGRGNVGQHDITRAAGDMAPLAVTAGNLALLAVTAGNLAPLAVTAGDMAPLGVTARLHRPVWEPLRAAAERGTRVTACGHPRVSGC